MPKTRLAIELAPDRLEIARLRGRSVVGAVRQWLNPNDWESSWQEGLEPLVGALGEALKALGVTNGIADVFHHGPDATSELSSHMLPPDAARQATILAMSDQLGVGLADCPHTIRVLASARSGGNNQSHVLFSSDSERSAEMLSAWLARCGIEVHRLVPMQSLHMSFLISHAAKIATEPTVVLRFGEQKSSIAVASRGKIRLARSLGLGVSRLTESLERPITTGDGREITLTHDEARQLLFGHGVPQRGDTIEPSGLSATDVLPAMQPVLQRCLVELRQSLRFGFDDDDRTNARLVVMGPGAAIPRLAEVLGSELSLPAEADGVAGFQHDQPAATGGDLSDALGTPSMSINLLPSVMAQNRTMNRLRTALVTGAATAMLIGGAQAMMWSTSAATTRSKASAFSVQVAQVQELEALRDQATSRTAAIASLEHAIDRSLGATPGVAGFLRELPTRMPATVELLDLRCARDKTGANIEIVACAFVADPDDPDALDISPTQQVSDLVAQLESSMLVDHVRLGNTQSTSIDSRSAMQFTLEIHLLGVPATMAASGETDDEVAP